MKKKSSVLLTVAILISVATGIYFLFKSEKFSIEKPVHTKVFANGQYEVRSFGSSNPLCGYDEVVEVSTNKIIYESKMCEANIIDIQQKEGGVIITKSSMIGKEEVVIPR